MIWGCWGCLCGWIDGLAGPIRQTHQSINHTQLQQTMVLRQQQEPPPAPGSDGGGKSDGAAANATASADSSSSSPPQLQDIKDAARFVRCVGG